MAAGFAAEAGRAGAAGRRALRRAAASGTSNCISIKAWPGRPLSSARGLARHRHESCCAGCLRAGHHRQRLGSFVSRRSGPRTECGASAQGRGRSRTRHGRAAQGRACARRPYVSESNFFEKDWQHSFWGSNYESLQKVKAKYDPEGSVLRPPRRRQRGVERRWIHALVKKLA